VRSESQHNPPGNEHIVVSIRRQSVFIDSNPCVKRVQSCGRI